MPDVFVSDDQKKSADPNHTLINPPDDKERHKIEGHSHNPLAAFNLHPDKIKFVNEDPEEYIVLLLRKHAVTNVGWIVVAFLMIIAPIFLPVLTFFELLPSEFKFIFVAIWYLITMAFCLEQFLSWFFHVNIITDERIIEVDFVNLFYREITDANIDQIQDVTVEVGGGIETFFHFGDIVIQTAAQIPKIKFEKVPRPDMVARVLRELKIQEEQEKLEGRVR